MAAGPSFLRRFIRPLVAGEVVHVGRPLGPGALPSLEAELAAEDDLVQEVSELRQQRAVLFWPWTLRLPLDEEALSLAVGMHDLLFLAHPDSDGLTVRESARANVIRQTELLLQRPQAQNLEQLVSRHTLIMGLFELLRTDIVLEHWLAVHTFRGQTPPPSLSRFPRLRRVHQHQEVKSWLDPEELDNELVLLLGALLRTSPLTSFFTPKRGAPSFSWVGLARYLRSPELCRVVAHHYLELGLAEIGKPLANAFWELTGLQPLPREELLLVSQLVVYLFATLLFVENPQADGEDPAASDVTLGSVLVAATEAGLLPAQAVLGEQRQQLESLAQQLRSQLSPPLRAQCENLAAVLAPLAAPTPGEEAA